MSHRTGTTEGSYSIPSIPGPAALQGTCCVRCLQERKEDSRLDINRRCLSHVIYSHSHTHTHTPVAVTPSPSCRHRRTGLGPGVHRGRFLRSLHSQSPCPPVPECLRLSPVLSSGRWMHRAPPTAPQGRCSFIRFLRPALAPRWAPFMRPLNWPCIFACFLLLSLALFRGM